MFIVSLRLGAFMSSRKDKMIVATRHYYIIGQQLVLHQPTWFVALQLDHQDSLPQCQGAL